MQMIHLYTHLAMCCAKSRAPSFWNPLSWLLRQHTPVIFLSPYYSASSHFALLTIHIVLNVSVPLPWSSSVFACFLHLWSKWSFSVSSVLYWFPHLSLELRLFTDLWFTFLSTHPFDGHACVVHHRFQHSFLFHFLLCHPQSLRKDTVSIYLLGP